MFHFISTVFPFIRNPNKHKVGVLSCLLFLPSSFWPFLSLSLYPAHLLILFLPSVSLSRPPQCLLALWCFSPFTFLSVFHYFTFTTFLSSSSSLYILPAPSPILSGILAFLHCGFSLKRWFFFFNEWHHIYSHFSSLPATLF